MQEQRLLERIASLETGNASNKKLTREQVLLNSIQAHLQRILNTRQGSVPIDPLFGVPDFTNLAGSFSVGSTPEVVKDLTRMISSYEPRLLHPKISVAEAENEVLSLSFQLEGIVQIDERQVPVRLATRVSSSGKVTLQAL
ncbi:type VI secretion system baseplate subunit TssE [Paenalcaligenes faecalis]|uniref:type VI secretion system baseplate subunit TssE n=1 Tax=Paenalcaligenes faecalis TaxID=2980099 RepID=UPI0022B9B64D|nr:type VI secretion system baseplate subunit TssE [Paenalcaligenes faecalis]